MTSPYQVTKDFEKALCQYTGAKFAVALNSCTAALLLCVKWFEEAQTMPLVVSIPRHTYVSVPQAIINANAHVAWRDEKWRGAYQLKPLPVWDCARRFTSGMHVEGQFECVSFSASKIMGIEQGGAILHDCVEADWWFRDMRFDGRREGTMPSAETIRCIGQHCLMLPSISAQALLRLHHLPKHNEDMEDYPYPDLSTFPVFK